MLLLSQRELTVRKYIYIKYTDAHILQLIFRVDEGRDLLYDLSHHKAIFAKPATVSYYL